MNKSTIRIRLIISLIVGLFANNVIATDVHLPPSVDPNRDMINYGQRPAVPTIQQKEPEIEFEEPEKVYKEKENK